MRTFHLKPNQLHTLLLQRTEYQSLPGQWIRKAGLGKIYDNMLLPIVERPRVKKIAGLYFKSCSEIMVELLPFLPKKPNRIMDIGCGLGGIDILLNNHYADQNIFFVFVDKSEISKKIFYGYENVAAAYNDIQLTEQFLLENGFEKTQFQVLDINKNSFPVNNKVDLVFSIISWGFHYPIQTYIKEVHKISHNDTKVIVDIRSNTDGLDDLTKFYDKVEPIFKEPKYTRYLATYAKDFISDE